MGIKTVQDTSLTSVANAIRVKAEISGTLEFPDGFVSAIQNLSPSPTLQTKTKTYTPTTSQQAESVVADSGYDGLDEVDVTVNAIPSQYKDTTDATATADKILQGYTAYANGQKLVGTASGGITPSGTIQITQNGQVDVTNYATADVNVSGGGGSSNVVQGTFHTESAYAQQNISIPYSGNGYPIGALIYPKDGPSGTSAFVSSTRQYALFFYSIIKSYVNQAPTYGTSNTDENKAWVTLQYKRSSSGIDMTTAGTRSAQVYTTTGVAPSTSGGAVRFRDNKTMQVMVHANSYGFLTDMDYEYIIIYSE